MIISKTPLRISFLGGGSDFPEHYHKHGGACLSAAINKYIYVIINPKHESRPAQITLNYGDRYETVKEAKDLKHDLIRSAALFLEEQYGIYLHGNEIATIADITSKGSGLGSSSSLLVGFLTAVAAINKDEFYYSKEWAASTANVIEVGMMNSPQGMQDAYPATFGGLKLYEFDQDGIEIDAGFSSVHTIDTRRLFSNLILYNTGTARQSKEILTEQHQKTAANAGTLSTLAAMARRGWGLLVRNRFDDFGDLLDEGWKIKKTLSSKITTPEIETMYSSAKRAGALGGKICGAGGGGYLLLYAPDGKVTAVRRAMGHLYNELPIGIEEGGSNVTHIY